MKLRFKKPKKTVVTVYAGQSFKKPEGSVLWLAQCQILLLSVPFDPAHLVRPSVVGKISWHTCEMKDAMV